MIDGSLQRLVERIHGMICGLKAGATPTCPADSENLYAQRVQNSVHFNRLLPSYLTVKTALIHLLALSTSYKLMLGMS